MALEITGLTIGALALIGTFKDCVDVFGMIISARSLTDDAEILNTKLDVEKMLLLQWADRVRLTEPGNYDSRLDDPDLNRTIARVLESIKLLLSDGKTLRDKYGVVEYQEVRHGIILDDRVGATASSTRLEHFIERFHRLSIQTRKPRQEYSVATRFKWVVKDKEKFTSLMDELSYFVSRLNALVPAQEQSGTTMTEEDLVKIRNIPQLKTIIKASTGVQPQVAIIAQQMIRSLNQGRVLDRLWFRSIDDRKTNINERQSRTLNWALDTRKTTLKWDNLAEWLRNGSGLYWLAGKAGSGKSTLMKYLSNHPQTTTLLKEWAAQSELVTLQFFFYALGKLEQKSQEGLLRSLLFQFLDKHRHLIEDVLPVMWREAIITEDKDHELEIPSISEMQLSLLQLVETVSIDRKFWILIDGLDEFEGKHATIATFFAKLQRLPNVKILVSSRPLPVFVGAFDHAPKMYLQDLTGKDIETYVNDSILHHPHMARLSRSEPREAKKVVEALVKKASGVFLWVVLACQSILEGLDEYDTIPELMNRAEKIPPELEGFFRQIIDAIDPLKRDQSARLLRLIFESQTRSIFDPIPTLGLAIVDEQGLRADFMGPNVTGLSDEESVLRCKTIEGRLRSRCSGLVEIQVDSNITLARQAGLMSAEDVALVNSCVVFLHRSLYEFFCAEGIWEQDVLRVDNECGRFEPHAILASLWTQLAGLHFYTWAADVHVPIRCYKNALAHNISASATKCPPEILATNFSRLQGILIGNERHSISWDFRAQLWLPHRPQCRKGCEDLSAGLAVAAEFGIVSLVRLALEDPDGIRRTLIPPQAGKVLDCSSLEACPTSLYKSNSRQRGSTHGTRSTVFPLLYHATCQPFLYMLLHKAMGRPKPAIQTMISVEVVQYLLGKGHDPNEVFVDNKYSNKTTPWIRWLMFIGGDGQIYPDLGLESQAAFESDLDMNAELAQRRAACTELLVDAGAELGAPGSHMQQIVDDSVSIFIRSMARRVGATSVAWVRSEDLWSKVRDKILLLRVAASHQAAYS